MGQLQKCVKSKVVVLNDKEEIVDFTKPTTSKTENIKKVEVPKKVSIPKKTIAPKKTTAPKKVTEVKKAETKTVPEQKNVETPKKTPEPKTPPLPKATCGDGKVNQTSEQCDPPGKQAQCYTGEKCNNKCLCEYQEEVAVCGDGKITYPEICDGSKFNQQCTNSINDYKKMNPSLVSRCFNNCRGCEAAAP